MTAGAVIATGHANAGFTGDAVARKGTVHDGSGGKRRFVDDAKTVRAAPIAGSPDAIRLPASDFVRCVARRPGRSPVGIVTSAAGALFVLAGVSRADNAGDG